MWFCFGSTCTRVRSTRTPHSRAHAYTEPAQHADTRNPLQTHTRALRLDVCRRTRMTCACTTGTYEHVRTRSMRPDTGTHRGTATCARTHAYAQPCAAAGGSTWCACRGLDVQRRWASPCEAFAKHHENWSDLSADALAEALHQVAPRPCSARNQAPDTLIDVTNWLHERCKSVWGGVVWLACCQCSCRVVACVAVLWWCCVL